MKSIDANVPPGPRCIAQNTAKTADTTAQCPSLDARNTCVHKERRERTSTRFTKRQARFFLRVILYVDLGGMCMGFDWRIPFATASTNSSQPGRERLTLKLQPQSMKEADRSQRHPGCSGSSSSSSSLTMSVSMFNRSKRPRVSVYPERQR